MHDPLPAPHGRSALPELLADSDHLPELKAACRSAVVWDLTPRQLCDLELLLNGGFSPLGGFMERADYESVCRGMRLKDGTLWPIPVVLDVTEDVAVRLARTPRLALHDPEGTPLALLRVEEVWKPDRRAEAEAVYGTTDLDHPGVAHLLEKTHTHYVGGRVEGLQLPAHYDFSEARLTPRDLIRLSRPGFAVAIYDTREDFYLAEALEYIDAWRQSTNDNPVGICGPIGPTEQLPLVARLVNSLDLDVRSAHFWGMDEWFDTNTGREVPVTHPLSFERADRAHVAQCARTWHRGGARASRRGQAD